MKIIEKIIKYDDYNYVEGTLQFKAYGRTTKKLAHSEFFSIDHISGVRLEIDKKYLAPELPPGINKQKVSSLLLPNKIPTIVDGDSKNPFAIAFDEIIVDDDFLDDKLNIVGRRFFTTKIGTQISSTVEIKVYGLIKIAKEYIEEIVQYEIYTTAHGLGSIEIFPKKDGYVSGEKVTIKAIPDANQEFLLWKDNYNTYPQELELEIDNDDIYIEAYFTDLIPSPVPSIPKGFISKRLQKNLKTVRKSWRGLTYNNENIGVQNAGCGDIIGWGFTIVFYGFIVLLLISLLGKTFFIIAGIVLFIYLLSLIPLKVFSWRFFSWLSILGFVFLLITGLANLSDNFRSYKEEQTERINPSPVTEEIINENETIDYAHKIKWKDYSDEWYETKLIVNSDIVQNAANYRNFQPALNDVRDYNGLLSSLYHLSQKDAYFRVIEKLDSIKAKKNFSTERFAEVIVTMVQSIPYCAIVEESCNPFAYRDPMIKELLRNNPCEPYVRYGIKSPAEFLKDLKGDCDTRTLFLYGLLKEKGYDVAIFGSQKYNHSLLGISLPINAIDYKIVNNKKYYLWEVTAEDFKPGFLPPSINDLRYWEVNLN